MSAEELTVGSARRVVNTGGMGMGTGMGMFGRAGRKKEGGVGMEMGDAIEEGVGRGNGDKSEGEEEEEGVKGMVKKVWMGDERPGWQARRLEREREELGRGKGYGDIIMEQVREVFPGFGGGTRKEEDGEGKEG